MNEPLREVTAALEMAADELGGLVRSLRDQGAEAFRSGDKASFAKIEARCEAVEAFEKRFAQLQQEWTGLSKQRRARRKGRRTNAKAAPVRGELLHHRFYVFPILRALKEAGGSAPLRAALRSVEHALAPQLGPRDREPIGRGQIRWDNRAQWVRGHLAAAGFLSASSPRGTWEITPAGLKELEVGNLEATWAKVLAAKQKGRR
jgi:hypothetical protein